MSMVKHLDCMRCVYLSLHANAASCSCFLQQKSLIIEKDPSQAQLCRLPQDDALGAALNTCKLPSTLRLK